MVSSVSMESIPHLTIHQLESFFLLEEFEKELIVSKWGGGNKKA